VFPQAILLLSELYKLDTISAELWKLRWKHSLDIGKFPNKLSLEKPFEMTVNVIE
jgi:hypothetical protein